jgi:hypothetical protein
MACSSDLTRVAIPDILYIPFRTMVFEAEVDDEVF